MDTQTHSVRTRLVQMNVVPGRPDLNTDTILREIAAARGGNAELVVFPEMAVPGYLLGDEWERVAFLRQCEDCGERIRAASKGLVVIFGNVAMDWERKNEDGRVRKYNAAFVAEDGTFLSRRGSTLPYVTKTLMPNYREFDDSRHFFDTRKLAQERGVALSDLLTCVDTRLGPIGCMLCEDGWHDDYGISPAEMLADSGAQMLVNISCSPFTWNKNHKRNRVFGGIADMHQVPMLYVNNVGIQNNAKTVYTFDGASCVYDGRGNQVNGPEPFEAGALECSIPMGGGEGFGEAVRLDDDALADIYKALRFGTERFMRSCGAERIVIGASGGIDSALVAALYSSFLPPEQLMLVNMPSRFNSDTTRGLARSLAERIGCLYADVSIEPSVAVTCEQLDGLHARSVDGSVETTLRVNELVMENIQARDRSSRILAGIAAAWGGVFTCNANKSEMTVGYTTLYGDLGGYLASIADLWKTEVWALSRFLNSEVFGEERIPLGSIDIVPSAELSDAQNVDEGKGDPLHYPYHDPLFAAWVEWWNRVTPEEILQWYGEGCLGEKIGYDGDLSAHFPNAAAFVADLERWWNLYQGMSIAKRIQAPPVLAVKRRAFGFDHRESQMGARYTQRYRDLKQELLGT